MKKMKLFNMITILMVTLLALSGCPRRRACVDTILPGCRFIGADVINCCHLGATYKCDGMGIYKSHSWWAIF